MITSHKPELPLAALAALVQIPVKRLVMLRRLGLLTCQDRDGVTVATEEAARLAILMDEDDDVADALTLHVPPKDAE